MTKDANAKSRAATINLFGGALCLDFANTVDWRTSDNPEEILRNYDDLLKWCRHTGAIDDRRAARLRRGLSLRPGQAGAAFEQAIGLREAIYQVFVALAN